MDGKDETVRAALVFEVTEQYLDDTDPVRFLTRLIDRITEVALEQIAENATRAGLVLKA